METSALTNLITEMGLGAALSIAIFISFFFLLKWVLGVSSEQLKTMHKERETWSDIQKSYNLELRQIQEQIKTNILTNQAFFSAVQEAHKFQREEHQEMIKALGRINGYKS